MARLLHKADFPCVSVLEGGFDALPLCLAARGCTITEPLLISHDAALFRKWRGCSDSDDKAATSAAAAAASTTVTTATSLTSPDHHSRAVSSSSTTTDGRHSPARVALAAAAAAGVGAYKTALKRAEAMGHSVAAAQLRAKLEQAIKHQASATAVLDEDDAAISNSLHNSSSSSSSATGRTALQQRSRRRFGSRSPSRSASPPKRAPPRLHSSQHSSEHSASSSSAAPTEQEAPALSQTTKLLARAGAAAAALGRGLGVSASDDAVQLERTESWVESAFLPRKDSSSSNKDSSGGVSLDSLFVV
jgi:hypothetical protein